MTLVVVLLFGLGAVLEMSAIATDPTTGKSVSVLQTIQNVWNNQLDFSSTAANSGAKAGSGQAQVYVPPSPATSTLAGASYTNASVANYLRTRRA